MFLVAGNISWRRCILERCGNCIYSGSARGYNIHWSGIRPTCDIGSGVNASSRLGGTSLVSRLSACLTEANWWRLIAE